MNRNLSLVILAFLLIGCSNGVNNTVGGAVGGTAAGAGIGAIIGSATGDAGRGTAIGAGIGALSGALIGGAFDAQNEKTEELKKNNDNNQRVIEENRRLLDELKRKGTDAYLSDRGVVVNMPDVLFKFGSSSLTNDAFETVRDIASVCKTSPTRDILVEGHTDSVGSDEYNLKLSRDRADSVADQLQANGIQGRRILVKGFGKSKPIASNNTDVGRQRNRRVEVIIANN